MSFPDTPGDTPQVADPEKDPIREQMMRSIVEDFAIRRIEPFCNTACAVIFAIASLLALREISDQQFPLKAIFTAGFGAIPKALVWTFGRNAKKKNAHFAKTRPGGFRELLEEVRLDLRQFFNSNMVDDLCDAIGKDHCKDDIDSRMP